MKKMNNTKKGFTLVEMVCVIAMIVLFSSVLFTNVVEYNATANRAADKVQEHELNNARAEDDVKSYLVGYTRQPAASATSATIDETRPGTAAPDAGGGQNATTIDVEAPDATIPPPQTTTTQEQTTTTAAPTTAAPANGGAGAGTPAGGGAGSEKIKAKNGVDPEAHGVAKFQVSGDGKTYTVTLNNGNKWNTVDMTIVDNGGSYTMNLTGGNKWNLDQNVFKDLWKYDSYTLTSAQMAYLENTFGLAFS
ncbi:MAG: type II secretion system protein [Clostridiales bacterium]|nr:type II secretion system protein [Clostridiales bacterium]